MNEKSLMARGHIRQLVLNGVLTSGSRIDVTEIAQTLRVSAAPVREALISLTERKFIKGGSRQNYHVHSPSQSEQLDALGWARALFQKAAEKFLLHEDRTFLISSIQVAASENDALHPTVFCYRIADALGKVGLSDIEYLLFSISIDSLLLAPPIESGPEHLEVKSSLTKIIELIVGDSDVAEIERQVSAMSVAVERLIVLAHTKSVADLLFREN